MITIEGLSKDFVTAGQVVSALSNVNLHVPRGSIFGVVGPSGAGKSTLVRCLALLERPSRGSIRLDGQQITHHSARELQRLRQRIGMIFQHFNLLAGRTAAENIALPLELRGLPRREIRQRVDHLLRLVGLSDKAGSYPAALSGGQKQRVGIARAIAADPAILLCDEATSALDPETTQTVLQLLQLIQRQTGITIVMITHQLGVVQDVCSHVAVMEAGRVVESGRTESVLLYPSTATARRLVGSLWSAQSPAYLADHLLHHADGLLQLTFRGQTALRPIISNLARKYGVSANILRGSIGQMGDRPFGHLLVQLQCSASQRQQAIAYLTGEQVMVEEVAANGKL